MTELRARMIREMTLRGYSPRTHQAYVSQMVGLVRHYRRSPDQIRNEEVRQYIAYLLQERKLSWSTCNQAAFAFRFFYHHTLGRSAAKFEVPTARQPQKLPEILSREEVHRLIEAPPNPKHRLLLATVYAAGLRVSEAVHLRVRDVDPQRMTLRIEQGKGAKDRYVPLSKRLLVQMRAYWKSHPPGTWLFPSRRTDRSMHISSAQKIWMKAKRRAGIEKTGGIHSLRSVST
jgi:integrase/recombinase XerD